MQQTSRPGCARDAALRLTGPLNYPALLTLIRHAAIVVTDSGGIQEEATVLKRPLIVTRRSNERPEVENNFGTRIPAGAIADMLSAKLPDIDRLHSQLAKIPSPYGDGTATTRIIQAVRNGFFREPSRALI